MTLCIRVDLQISSESLAICVAMCALLRKSSKVWSLKITSTVWPTDYTTPAEIWFFQSHSPRRLANIHLLLMWRRKGSRLRIDFINCNLRHNLWAPECLQISILLHHFQENITTYLCQTETGRHNFSFSVCVYGTWSRNTVRPLLGFWNFGWEKNILPFLNCHMHKIQHDTLLFPSTPSFGNF